MVAGSNQICGGFGLLASSGRQADRVSSAV